MAHNAWFEEYIQKIRDVLGNDVLRAALGRATSHFSRARFRVIKDMPYYEYYRKRVREAKLWSLEHMDELIKMAKENIEGSGGVFYFANTGREAINHISNTLESRGAKIIVKGKSMVTEEIFLRKALTEKGFKVFETDLGEFLIQIRNEKPSHVVVPAVHLTVEEVAKTLSQFFGEEVPWKHESCVKIVRDHLRELYFKADAGISGANAIAADTGTIVIVENEGNVRFTTNAPPVHIVVTGIEKLFLTLEDAVMAVMVIAPNAIGLKMPTYVSLITGPSSTSDIELVSVKPAQGPRELHAILLDNGRTSMLKDLRFRQALMCLRCGACLNVCPVFRELSGLVWGYTYCGGIGAVWTAFVHGLDKAAPLIFTCVLCGRCKVVCPMEIDTPGMILNLRQRLVELGIVPPPISDVIESIEKYGNPYKVPEHDSRTLLQS